MSDESDVCGSQSWFNRRLKVYLRWPVSIWGYLGSYLAHLPYGVSQRDPFAFSFTTLQSKFGATIGTKLCCL